MPSKSEPCGLSQMVALRYGTLPIVRETGGLKDSITAAKNNVLNIALIKALFKHFFHKVYTFVTYKSCNNADDFSNKAKNKAELQKMMGMNVDPDVPVVCIVVSPNILIGFRVVVICVNTV